MRAEVRICSALRILAFVAWAWLFLPPATAQFAEDPPVRAAPTGGVFNLFMNWDGNVPLAGVDLVPPEGWTLRDATIVRNAFHEVSVRSELPRGRTRGHGLRAEKAIEGPATLVLSFDAPANPQVGELQVTPLIARPGSDGVPELDPAYRTTRTMRAVRAPRSTGNRALAFHAGTRAPMMLRADRLPDLTAASGYTLEFWLKTTARDRVVVSTWDGDEASSYPLELVIGKDGRVFLYRGRPGQHLGISSKTQVADGTWYHVAVTSSPTSGFTHLLVNGCAEDSLYAMASAYVTPPGVVAIGGRATQRATAGGEAFEGQIDELRFWGGPRTPDVIRANMRRPLTNPGDGNVLLSFERPVPAQLLAEAMRDTREPTDLTFDHPIQGLQASVRGDEVTLTWETRDPSSGHFEVERSFDEVRFIKVGRIGAGEAAGDGVGEGGRRYAFSDVRANEPVVYYRIRRFREDGTEGAAATVKIGLGGRDQSDEEPMVGNYPNPFNASTVISYRLEESAHVRLSIWDISGQPVAELVSETVDAGRHEVPFDGGDLPSGTYFVRLQTSGEVAWHTLTLTK